MIKRKRITTQKIINNIMEEVNNRELGRSDIATSDIAFDEKVKAMELLLIIKGMRRDSFERLALKNQLYKKVKYSYKLTDKEKAIANKLLNYNNDITNMEQKILRSKHPINIKSYIYKKYKQLINISDSDPIFYKTKNLIDIILKLPTSIINIDNYYDCAYDLLHNVNLEMNKNLYGQIHVKEKIIEIVASMIANPTGNNKCIVFLGPPGVGKTYFAKTLAYGIFGKWMKSNNYDGDKLPFDQISFGGMTDSSFLKGHDFTFIGSTPGAIARAVIKIGEKNGILYLDELDKISQLDNNGISSSLLHIMDYTQNNKFIDSYMPHVPIDISKLIIIVSINSIKNINKVLLDRLDIIKFKDYTIDDKINIAITHLLPKLLKNLKMKKKDVVIQTHVMKYIIENTYKEKGVRQLKRNISKILTKINVLKQLKNNDMNLSYDIENFKIPIKLTKQYVNVLLNIKK